MIRADRADRADRVIRADRADRVDREVRRAVTGCPGRRPSRSPVQAHLALSDTRRILIPIPSNEIQKSVQDKVLNAEDQRARSEELYAEAEPLLASSLGFDKLKLPGDRSFEKSFAEVLKAAIHLEPEATCG